MRSFVAANEWTLSGLTFLSFLAFSNGYQWGTSDRITVQTLLTLLLTGFLKASLGPASILALSRQPLQKNLERHEMPHASQGRNTLLMWRVSHRIP